MKNLRKSLGLFAAAFALCMVFALGAKVNAADVEMQIGNADAGKGQVQKSQPGGRPDRRGQPPPFRRLPGQKQPGPPAGPAHA